MTLPKGTTIRSRTRPSFEIEGFDTIDYLNSDTKELSPEELVIVAVIRLGIFDKDLDYILGEVFMFHCDLLNIDGDKARRHALGIING